MFRSPMYALPMSSLHDFTTVACPFEDVPGRLRAYFGGDAGTMPVLVMVGDLGVERNVEIRLSPRPSYPGYRLLDVEWKSKDGGPYPVFHGTLSVADEGAGRSRLDLDGTYEPPFGVAGAAFDAAVGHRIAGATASELLSQFRDVLTRP
jgi:hypothetical protein